MPTVLCKGCGQRHDNMLVRCPEIIAANVPYRGRLVEIVQEEVVMPTRKLKRPMIETKEVRLETARQALTPSCKDQDCGYRKLYEAQKSKNLAKVKLWRAKRRKETPF